MKKIFFVLLIVMLFTGFKNNNTKKDSIKYLDGKYHYRYYYNNGTINTTFDQYIDFNKNGTCKYVLNMCEGFSIESDNYSIINEVVKIAKAGYELTILDASSLRFDKNIEDFTCNNKGKKDTIILKKQQERN